MQVTITKTTRHTSSLFAPSREIGSHFTVTDETGAEIFSDIDIDKVLAFAKLVLTEDLRFTVI